MIPPLRPHRFRVLAVLLAGVSAGMLAGLPAGAERARVAPAPMLADPAAIRVELLLPEGIAMLPGSAALVFTLTGAQIGPTGAGNVLPAGAVRTAVDPLVRVTPAPIATDKARAAAVALRLADPGAARLRAVQAAGRAMVADGSLPGTVIEVTFTPCRVAGAAATDATNATNATDGAQPLSRPVSLSLRLARAAPALPLLARGTTLGDLLRARGLAISDCP